MSEDNGPINLNRVRRRAIERRIEEKDASHLDPMQRAELVHTLLLAAVPHEGSNTFVGETWWDVFCFCTAFLAQSAVIVEDESLLALARSLNSWTHSAHYAEAFELTDTKVERLRFWADATIPLMKVDENENNTEPRDPNS